MDIPPYLRKVREAGKNDEVFKRYLELCNGCALQWEHLQGSFMLYGILVALAMTVFLGELLVWKMGKNRKKEMKKHGF